MTPTILRKNGYRFFFFSREETRMHVHVMSNKGEAKFWLEPQLELAMNYGFARKEIKEIENLIEERFNEFVKAWREYFTS
jgi:hypothetical protein